jgi:lactocepin
LTPPAGLTKEVLDEVKRLAPDKVFIAGSGKAVSTVVETQLSTLSKKPSVKRFAGVDRFDTAAQIAEELQSKVGAPERVIVVNGYKFPDALSAAPLAAAKGWPILLTKVNSVPNYTSAAITKSGASLSLVAGSETVVDKNVYNALPGPTRAGGDNRYETCGLVADFAVSQGCSYEHVGIAKGTHFPDALAAGPYLGAKNGIGLLSYPGSLPKPILDRLKANKMSVATVDIFGSTNAIADEVIFEIDDALR